MTPIVAPANLPDLVRAAFAKARTAGDLTFFPTQVALLRVRGLPFQLRFAPSLARKPKPKPAPADEAEEKTKAEDGSSETAADGSKEGKAAPAPVASPKPFDPFADPIVPNLLVVPQLGASHRLVLNKFAICQDHAILATTAFRPQHHLLDAEDLAAAYACIEAYHHSSGDVTDKNDGLFVFFNSGSHSGASQPHRHLQMLPVARMREGLEGMDGGSAAADTWSVLADRIAQPVTSDGEVEADVPFFVATALLRAVGDGPAPSPESLHATYLQLYRQACAAADADDSDEAKISEEERGEVPARISYNLALTRQTMALCPRLAEGAPVVVDKADTETDKKGTTADKKDADKGATTEKASAGSLSLNGTVLAGTALVKNEAEWNALRSDPAALAQILGKIGVPLDSNAQEMAFL